MLQRGKRVFNIDPPTSPNAIMRRAKPLPRREQWTRQVHQYQGELDPNPRVREQPRLIADLLSRSDLRPLYPRKRTFFITGVYVR
jgi:hypothetical protein